MPAGLLRGGSGLRTTRCLVIGPIDIGPIVIGTVVIGPIVIRRVRLSTVVLGAVRLGAVRLGNLGVANVGVTAPRHHVGVIDPVAVRRDRWSNLAGSGLAGSGLGRRIQSPRHRAAAGHTRDGAALFVAAETEPVLGRGLAKLFTLLVTPAELAADAEFTAKSMEVFANPAAWPVPAHPGPTRRELLAALAGPDPTTEPSELANEGAA